MQEQQVVVLAEKKNMKRAQKSHARFVKHVASDEWKDEKKETESR